MTEFDMREQSLEAGRQWRVTGFPKGEPPELRTGAPAAVRVELWTKPSQRLLIEIEPEHARWFAADLIAMADVARRPS